MGALGKDQLDWLEDDLRGRSASTPIVVFAHIPLWAVYPQWGWGTQDSAEALSYLKRFGSVTVLNGHIHQIMHKVEGNVSFHTAMATAFPQPVPGTAPSPGPLTVPADKLRRVLGITNVNYIAGGHQLAVLDSTLAGTPAEESIEILGAAAATTSQAQPQPAANAQAPAAAPASSPSVSGEVVQVSIDNFAFTPRTLTMRKGTSVAWTNHDVALPTGLLAWQFQFEGQKLKGILLLHLVLALASSGMIWVLWWVTFGARRREATRPGYVLALEFLTVAAVVLTAHLGGFLSGVNGPG